MEYTNIAKKTFSVLGKEGKDENKLWEEINNNFNEIESYAKKNNDESIFALWGISDNNIFFASVEVKNDTIAPKGWIKKDYKAYEYIKVIITSENSFEEGLQYLKDKNLKLVGPVLNHFDPSKNEKSIWFPIKDLTGAIWN